MICCGACEQPARTPQAARTGRRAKQWCGFTYTECLRRGLAGARVWLRALCGKPQYLAHRPPVQFGPPPRVPPWTGVRPTGANRTVGQRCDCRVGASRSQLKGKCLSRSTAGADRQNRSIAAAPIEDISDQSRFRSVRARSLAASASLWWAAWRSPPDLH